MSACARAVCARPASAAAAPRSCSSAALVSPASAAHAVVSHLQSNSWSDTGTRRVKGGVSGLAEDLRPVSEVEAGVNFRPAGGVREQVAGSLPGRPGPGTRWVRGGVVTPSLHPEVPDTRFASPGRGLGMWLHRFLLLVRCRCRHSGVPRRGGGEGPGGGVRGACPFWLLQVQADEGSRAAEACAPPEGSWEEEEEEEKDEAPSGVRIRRCGQGFRSRSSWSGAQFSLLLSTGLRCSASWPIWTRRTDSSCARRHSWQWHLQSWFCWVFCASCCFFSSCRQARR